MTDVERPDMDATECTDVEVVELTSDEGLRFFDDVTRYELGMSGEDFLREYDRGAFDGDPDETPGLASVLMALPFAR